MKHINNSIYLILVAYIIFTSTTLFLSCSLKENLQYLGRQLKRLKGN